MAILLSALSFHSRSTHFILLAIILLGATYFLYSSDSLDVVERLPLSNLPSWLAQDDTPNPLDIPPEDRPHHPIDDLIKTADRDFDHLLSNQTLTLQDAAAAYRKRRGRQPPPGFDVWWTFAHERSAVMVEAFWDQIYDDLGPFWGVSAKQMREQANVFLHRVSVRSHVVDWRSDGQERPWMVLWADLVRSVAAHLPDMDIAINVMDESRLAVPWEEINRYMQAERTSRRIVSEGELKDEFHGLKELDETPPPSFKPQWQTSGLLWPTLVGACPPQSPARSMEVEKQFASPPQLSKGYPKNCYEGYVANFTFAKSPCDNPEFQGLHGSFIEPVSLSTSKKLFPLFGGSKLPMNNEILLPPAMYYTDDPFYSGGKTHGKEWHRKHDGMIWRGAASGGRNRKENWTRFQRHRFVSMVNGTSVELAERDPASAPPNFVLPEAPAYNLSAQQNTPTGAMGEWVRSWGDAQFVNLLCFPPSPKTASREEKRRCSYTSPFFRVEDGIPMSTQYNYKYLPDVDGNSFSGRYRGFLGSTSMPIKATIYNEWHDSRLVPWRHFVPMHNTFADIYGIMEYFVGNKFTNASRHDDVGERIALEGKEWTEKVLRKEDMQIYVFRLLLEYARLCDDNREVLGWKESTAVAAAAALEKASSGTA